MTDSNEVIVGIDLGTTNSVVAAIVDGKPKVLTEDGESVLPSIVGLDNDGNLITGVIARNQLAAFPDRTVASVKRKMGSMDAIKMGDQTFTPPEISAMILRRLCDRASRALGKPVKRAVITVPAFFDENQRQATREAGLLAGLTVERIINEPTAATLVYHAGTHDPRHIVVYDFGGGTFDVSVVRMESGVVEVLSSKGDTQLGGDDLDRLLLDHVAVEFKQEHGIDLRKTDTTRFRLLQACEKAKCELSESANAEINEEFIAEVDGQPVNLKTTITRSEYETMIEPLIDRTIRSVDEALLEVGLATHQIDDLVLVGGSTRTPLVAQRLREEFDREPSRSVDPDLAVALGAATQAGMHDGASVGPVLVDVVTHTLGIEAVVRSFLGEKLMFSPIIHRNTPLPARYEERYSTVIDNQKVADIHVYQGEHEMLERNQSIGQFNLDLEQGAGNLNWIDVRFDLTLDGTLKVSACQTATGRSEELVIDNALSKFKSEDRDRAEARLGAMFDASSEIMADEDLPSSEQWEDAKESTSGVSEPALAKNSAKFPAAMALLEQVDKLIQAATKEDADEIKELAEQLRESIESNDETKINAVSSELDDLLYYIQ